jgi:hypothetical protein
MTNLPKHAPIPLALHRRTLLGSAAAGMLGSSLGWHAARAA